MTTVKMQGLQPWSDGGTVYVGRQGDAPCPTLVCARLSAFTAVSEKHALPCARLSGFMWQCLYIGVSFLITRLDESRGLIIQGDFFQKRGNLFGLG